MEHYNHVCTPMVTWCNLSSHGDSPSVSQLEYISMIRILLYLTGARPDILHTVGIVWQFQENPKETHLHAIKLIFKYLQAVHDYGLWCPKDAYFSLHAYTDAYYTGNIDDRKSTSGGEFYLGRHLVSWFNKK